MIKFGKTVYDLPVLLFSTSQRCKNALELLTRGCIGGVSQINAIGVEGSVEVGLKSQASPKPRWLPPQSNRRHGHVDKVASFRSPRYITRVMAKVLYIH